MDLLLLACRFGWTPAQVAEIPDYLLAYLLDEPEA